MDTLPPELRQAISDVLDAATDQGAEFKRRLRRLIENAITAHVLDEDVREVIQLAAVGDDEED